MSNPISRWWDRTVDAVEGGINAITGRSSAAEKRAQAQQIQDQIDAYKNQTEITQKEIADKQQQEAVEKRRINEKQIRSLRGNYRAAGFLNNGADTSQNLNNTLPNKLGA